MIWCIYPYLSGFSSPSVCEWLSMVYRPIIWAGRVRLRRFSVILNRKHEHWSKFKNFKYKVVQCAWVWYFYHSCNTRHEVEQRMVVTSLAVNLTSNNVFRHGLTLLWFKDLINVTEKLQFIDPRFRHPCLVPSSGLIWSLSRQVLLYAHKLAVLFSDEV